MQESRVTHPTFLERCQSYICFMLVLFLLLEQRNKIWYDMFADIKECAQNPNPCSQSCLETEGSFECGCSQKGYQLAKDKRTCISKHVNVAIYQLLAQHHSMKEYIKFQILITITQLKRHLNIYACSSIQNVYI